MTDTPRGRWRRLPENEPSARSEREASGVCPDACRLPRLARLGFSTARLPVDCDARYDATLWVEGSAPRPKGPSPRANGTTAAMRKHAPPRTNRARDGGSQPARATAIDATMNVCRRRYARRTRATTTAMANATWVRGGRSSRQDATASASAL